VSAAVILAAGASTRLGRPKQLITLAGETLLERAVRVATEADCWPIVVVLGAEAGQILAQCSLRSVAVLTNPWWQEGMASSVRLGVAAVSSWDGVVLMTCDQPAVTPEHLHRLMSAGGLTASGYAGSRGVPAYFPASSFPQLMELTGDSGARSLLHSATAVPLADGELDLDTEAEVYEAQQRFV
jgi:CTP:molybdopterin cytidylyltransferase MocA